MADASTGLAMFETIAFVLSSDVPFSRRRLAWATAIFPSGMIGPQDMPDPMIVKETQTIVPAEQALPMIDEGNPPISTDSELHTESEFSGLSVDQAVAAIEKRAKSLRFLKL